MIFLPLLHTLNIDSYLAWIFHSWIDQILLGGQTRYWSDPFSSLRWRKAILVIIYIYPVYQCSEAGLMDKKKGP